MKKWVTLFVILLIVFWQVMNRNVYCQTEYPTVSNKQTLERMSVNCNTVADMKSNPNLTPGQTVLTKGYYVINDGGQSLYNIRAKKHSDIDDGGKIIFLNNGNVAEYSKPKVVTPIQFGAVGDGITDDFAALQNAVNYANEIDGLGKTYKIYPTEYLGQTGTTTYKALCITKSFKLKNIKIVMSENAERGMCCVGINTDGYVEIENVEIDGNASKQPAITGDGANHGIISVVHGKDGYIHINHCTIKGARTDGIMHRSGYLLLENSTIIDDGRNGITCDKSARIYNCTFDNTHAFRMPMYSIYHEPNEGYNFVSDIEIDSCHFTKARKCIDFYPADSTSTLRNVTVENCDCKEGKLWNCVVSNVDGRVENVLVKNNHNVSIVMNATDSARVFFGKVTIDNNTGSSILIGGSSKYRGKLEELIIKNTNFYDNQIKFRTLPQKIVLDHCLFDKKNHGTGVDSHILFAPSSRKVFKDLYVKDCTIKNAGTLISAYQPIVSGDTAVFENCQFEGLETAISAPFKHISLTNCMFTDIRKYTLSQNNLNSIIQASNCIFNQSKEFVYKKCGTVKDVNCTYLYSNSRNGF